MNVQVRLFASAREAAGVGHLLLELPEGATVRDAIAAITTLHPLVGEIRQMVIARDREYVGLDSQLAEGSELALIPPVSGGAVAGRERILVSPSPLSVDAAIDAVRGADAGGIVVFLGTVRDASRGKRVRHLEYEAYAEMAEDVMEKLAAELQERHDLCAVAIHHRFGRLEIGEASVVIAVSAPHRQAALDACREAIDTLKETVPLWKKEVYEGGEEWIGRGS
jgi:molybdopterin synthase catalytic subunit/molybdopterin converting factor small subunit